MPFIPEIPADFMSYFVKSIPIYFACILQPLQFGLFPLIYQF
jgi:hypothetical protein